MSLIADIFDVLIVDDKGEMLASSSLSSADINIQVNSTEVRAGRGDALIAVLHSGRQADITLAEVEFKWDWLAKQLGQTATTGAVEIWALPKWYKAVATEGTVTITLDNKPLATNSGIKIYDANGKAITGTVAGKVVTFATGVKGGDAVEVRGYKYTSPATASEIIIDNISFADGVKCILETIEIDEDETQLSKVQYIFDEALFDGNINIQTKKERDAIVTNVALKAVKPRTSNTIGRVIKIPLGA